MGTFEHPIEVQAAGGGPFESVEALVDTGATFSRLPGDLVARLGYEAIDRDFFTLGDGRVVEFGLTEVKVRLDGKVKTTTCMIGEPDTQSLLGAVTLEQFLLAPDPIHGTFIKVEGY